MGLELLLINLVLGVIPCYYLLKYIGATKGITLAIAIGFSFFSVSIFHILALKLVGTKPLFIFMTVFVVGLLISSIRKFRNKSSEHMNLTGRALSGMVLGFFLWKMLARFHFKSGNVYRDTFWNLSLISELKKNFPPIYPMWYEAKGTFIYHYFADLYWAGLANFSNEDLFRVVLEFGPLYVWLCFGMILALAIPMKRYVFGLAFAVFFSLLLFTKTWTPIIGLALHLSGCTSTFFWGLPFLLSSVLFWSVIDKRRRRLSGTESSKLILYSFLIGLNTFVLTFFKGSSGFVLVTLEFSSLIHFWIQKIRHQEKIKLKSDFFYTSLGYAFSPCALLFVSKLMEGSSALLTQTEVVRDKLQGLEGATIFVPFIILFGISSFYLILLPRLRCVTTVIYGASLVNFVFYFLYTHHSYSEIYFIFNVFVLNIFFYISIYWKGLELKKISIAVFLHTILGLSFFLDYLTPYPVVKFMEFNRLIYDSKTYKDGEVEELRAFSRVLSNNSLVLVSGASCKIPFISASLESRVFAECLYSPDDALAEKRVGIQDRFALGSNMRPGECIEFLNKYPVTHVLLQNKLDQLPGFCLKESKQVIAGEFFKLYVLQ
ncbi:MAG: hypothetical protein KDD61_07315 [Bdellovibrionales bacterium]|nr:hypothetical protein [Bdellovibrionales bacterium]